MKYQRQVALWFVCSAPLLFSIVGCAAAPGSDAGKEVEPTIHEYRTGSLLAQRERRITTDAEREQAQKAAEDIRRAGGGFGNTPNR